MSSDSAIERTRELLDERGVKHAGNGGMVRWTNESGCKCRAYARPNHSSVDVAIMDVPPEQAIAATLGPGTCHDAACKQMAFFACSACGSTDERKKPRFCHECGRRVVDDVLRTE